jgi:hypothetical protein
MENGETVFENIDVPFVAEVSLEGVVWKGKYAGQLRSEQENIKTTRVVLDKEIELLREKIFDSQGNDTDRSKREGYEAELKKNDLRLKEIESILEKLPAAYKEIGQNESGRFHYSVFLESAEGKRKLLILTTF